MPKPDVDLLRSEQTPIDPEDRFLALRILRKYGVPIEPEEPGVEKCATCERPAWTCRKCGGVRCGHKCSDKDRESMTATCLDCVAKGDLPGHPFRGNQWTGGHAAGDAPEDYGDSYRPPSPENGAPLHDLTRNGVYPGDVYTVSSRDARAFYGTGSDAMDVASVRIVQRFAGKPDEKVTIYRAVPKNLRDAEINPGDWVTINREYAEEHGDSRFDGKYRILERTVTAKELFTNGNSIHEWGWWPDAETPEADAEREARHQAIKDRIGHPEASWGRAAPGPMAEWAIRSAPLLKAEFDESQHPREPAGSSEGGQFTSGAGGGGGGAPAAGEAKREALGAAGKAKGSAFDLDSWKTKFSKDPKATIGEWMKLKPSERMKLADPLHSIPARMKEHLGDAPWPERSGSIRQDVENRLNQFARDIHPDSHTQASKMLMSMNDALTRLGVPVKDADRMMRNATDHLLAQEFESQTRLLGDHGAAHLSGDWRLSTKILDEIPGGPASPREAALMAVTAIYHDAAYMTPPMRASLPGHQAEGAYYFKKSIAPIYEGVLGKEWTNEVERIIAHHDTDKINFADRRLTSFALADNLALFHREKLPPAIRQVKGNADMLVRLAEGQITQQQAEDQYLRNIDRSTLSSKAKARMKEGLYDLTKRTRESVLAMYGAKINAVKWTGEYLDINLTRNASNQAIGKVLDVHQNGFKKLCEAYKVDANNPDLVANGFTFEEKGGRSKVRFRFTDAWATKADDPSLWDEDVIQKFDPDQPRDEAGRWTDGSGALPEIQRGRMIEHTDDSYTDSQGNKSPPAGTSTLGPVKWQWRFREEFKDAPASATVMAGDVDMEYERHAVKSAIDASNEFWADDSADARAIRAADPGTPREALTDASQHKVSITTVFTMNAPDVGAGSGGTGSAKVFWAPYSASNRERRLDSAARTMGLDPIYVLAHEYHHALGYPSELDLSSEVAAVAGHFRAGVPNSHAVQDALFSWRANMDRKAVFGRALRYVRSKYPAAFAREGKKQFSYDPDDDQSYKDAQEKAWRDFNAKLDAIGRRKRSE